MYLQLRLVSKEPLFQQMQVLQVEFTSVFNDLWLLSESDVVTATHQTRKALKLYRAVVKLLKQCPFKPDSLISDANAFLRDSGQEFSRLRDSHVRSLLLKDMDAGNADENSRKVIKQLTELNNKEVAALESRLLDPPNQFKILADSIAGSRIIKQFFQNISPQDTCILAGLEESFLKSENAFANTKNESQYELFHEWRKRLKDVQNQLKILLGEEPSVEYPFYLDIDEICENLGYLNDLAMLSDWISETSTPVEDQERGRHFSLNIKHRIEEVKNQLLHSGNRFYNQPEQTLIKLTSTVAS